MTVWTVYPQWLAWLSQHGYRKRTLEYYRQGLLAFGAFWGRRSLSAVDMHAIELWMAKLHQEDAALSTRRGYLTALRQFGRWLVREGLWPTNHAALVPYPRGQRELPAIPESADVERLLAWLEERCGTEVFPKARALALRDRAMVEVAYGSALRPSEVVGLHIKDVNFERRYLRVRDGKGGRQRVVPLGEVAAAAILEYLRHGRPELLNGHRPPDLFLTSRGTPARYETFRTALLAAGRAAGLAVPIAPHGLRRRAATDCYIRSRDPRFVAELLGHANLATVMVYARVEPRDLQEQYRRNHPRACATRSADARELA